MEPYKTIESETLLKARIFDVVRDTITLPNGLTTFREVIIHGGASAIIPVDKNGNIILVRQYRHPAKEMVLEIPAGTLEKGEDPKICAARELEEETGYKSDDITFLFSIYSAIGFCNEVLHIYIAENLIESQQNLDHDEFVTVETFSLEDTIKMIFNNEIKDSKTISAVLAYSHMKMGRG